MSLNAPNGFAENGPTEPVALAKRVSREFLVHHRLCPTGVAADGLLAVAVTESSLLEGIDDLSVAYDCPVVTRVVPPAELDLLIARLTTPADGDLEVAHVERDDDGVASDVRDLANQPPVVRYVNLLIREAYDAGASDIHLQSVRAGLETRLRIDGVLLPALEPPPRAERAVISRIKLLADLDIAERRRPQDGRIRVRVKERNLDLRVSTVPTVSGESVVLRLLERRDGAIPLESLGLPNDLLMAMQRLAQRPHGMILVTGPTGSGKTTTLYSALGLRDAGAEKIVTLEDPVEYALERVTQVPVHAQTGITFAGMLRSILRQDPDVILVGEMRDTETAALAVQAALTGHVVFSTLHTSDAIGAIPRLLDLGVPPFLITATLDAVLAQRLVRKICDACKETYDLDQSTLARLSRVVPSGSASRPTRLARGRGCAACRGTGYRGRIGLFELFELNDGVREAITQAPERRTVLALAEASGMRTLQADGWSKAQAGVTTIEEVLRVTQE